MTRDEMIKERDRLFREENEKIDALIKKAKKEGKWQMGLDSNKKLLKPVHDEYHKKAQELWDRYQKEKED